jgi:hypothetical protein
MDARLRAIVRYFQACSGPADADLSGLARELHPHVFICQPSTSASGDIAFKFAHLGGRLERELRRSCLKETTAPLCPDILGAAALRALKDCAVSGNAIWLREAATTSDQSGRFIELAAVYRDSGHICGGILYSPTGWFYTARPMLKVLPLNQAQNVLVEFTRPRTGPLP